MLRKVSFGAGVAVIVGTRVWVAVGVKVGVKVGVIVGEGVIVGPNIFPGPQEVRRNEITIKTRKLFLIMG